MKIVALFFFLFWCNVNLHMISDDCLIESHYHVEHTSSRDIMRMLAFASCVVCVMGRAFRTYEKVRYRAFVKRVGRTIRYLLQQTWDKILWFDLDSKPFHTYDFHLTIESKWLFCLCFSSNSSVLNLRFKFFEFLTNSQIQVEYLSGK